MIRISNLSKSYGSTKAVDSISFEVKESENVVLLGKSGCGKTTCLKMINRLIEADEGTIEINGHNIREQKREQLRRSIGYVIQDTGLFPHYTVAENIAVVPRLLKWPEEKIKERTHRLMEKLHLPPGFLGKYPAQLSGGQQQRVGLARALAADPPVILMDEPFGALDPLTRSGIRREFLTLDELQQKTIVMVTHDMQEAVEFADRIVLMDKGRIVQAGPPRELVFEPANKFVKDFFAANRLQLQLAVLRLKDLLPYLDGHIPAGTGSSVSIKAERTLLDALELINNADESLLAIEGTGDPVYADGPQILTAFERYQQKEVKK